jgi:hypothetical protein
MGLPTTAGAGQAPSWLKRPSAVRLAGTESGLNGSISTTQPKVLMVLRKSRSALAAVAVELKRAYSSAGPTLSH